MATKRVIRSTKDQIIFLCAYMRDHPHFAAGNFKTPLGARQNQQEWNGLKEALDELGPQRSVEQWKVCWRDQKRKARVEGGAQDRALNQTGNSAPKRHRVRKAYPLDRFLNAQLEANAIAKESLKAQQELNSIIKESLQAQINALNMIAETLKSAKK